MSVHDESKRSKGHTPALPVAPVLVSQINCASAVGLDPRRYRELVQRLGVPHARVGKLVVTELSALRAALVALAVQPDKAPAAPAPANDGCGAELEDVDDVLRVIGRRRRTA